MSTNLPIRALRETALRRQCLFHHRRALVESPLSVASRAFSNTAARGASKRNRNLDAATIKLMSRNQLRPSPKAFFEKKQRETKDAADDIGILQGTIIRARLQELPNWWTLRFWSYFWNMLKTEASSLYSRSVYHRILVKHGWKRWLPVDFLNHRQLRTTAGSMYERICIAFAERDLATIRRFCLPPLAADFQSGIAARGNTKMSWKMGKASTRVMSHRASILGGEDEGATTAYRQVVVRVKSSQTLNVAGNTSAQQKDVTEYVVLQKRIQDGVEDEHWKVWGFAEESTPAKILEDEEYWRRMMSYQSRVAV